MKGQTKAWAAIIQRLQSQ